MRDEVYYREAVAMGLDQNDPLIRRGMRQKLKFILEDLTAEEASDEVLAAYLTVPLGGNAGKILRLGKLPINTQLAAFYNVERPDNGAEWQLRFQLQFLFPK